jgi:hypothetical protein
MVTVAEVGMVQERVVGLEVLSMRRENQASRLWSGMYVFFFLGARDVSDRTSLVAMVDCQ